MKRAFTEGFLVGMVAGAALATMLAVTLINLIN